MATQSVEFSAPSGQTVTARLFAAGSDTVVQTASAVTEATNRDGVYTATFTDAPAGLYRLIATSSGGTLLAQWWVDLTLTTAAFQAYEMPVSVIQSGLSTFDAGSDTVTVGTNNDKTDYSLTTAPPTAAAIASAVWSAATRTLTAFGFSVTVGTNNDKSDYALSETSRDAIIADFLAHVITKGSAGTIERAFWQAARAQASAVGEVAGTPTASAFDSDLTAVSGAFDHLLIVFTSGSLEGEARPIDTYVSANGRITLQEPLTAAPSAADEFLIVPSHVHKIADIQGGLATSDALAVVDAIVDQLKSRSGYTMSILAGAISNAQNAAEAYTITLDGTAYSVTYSGLDSSGNRTGATLTET